MRFPAFLLVAFLFGGIAAAAESNDADPIKAAERVAKNFLASIDAGNAAGAEKLVYQREQRAQKSGRITRSPIVKTHSEIEQRRRFGRLQSRTLAKTEIIKDVSGFPTGLFVRFTYAVRYDKKDTEQTEILTIKADNPQRWKVVGF